MAQPIEELKKIRLEKLEKIQKLGIDPFPAVSKRQQKIAQSLKMMGKKVTVAGRIVAMRGHGKIYFFDLLDESGKIQIVFKFENFKGKKKELFELLDIGDFIDVEGEVFKTKAGEISVLVNNFDFLAKSLRPLPSKWYGLKDVEERYRKRYLDLIINPGVKSVFEKRSLVIASFREFLLENGYYEVETPVLHPLYGGALARPFKTYHNALGIPLYMRISTELYLKRLIVGGFEKVFEVNKVFRNEGIDRQHNPEFTLLETMEAYIDYKKNMEITEKMIEYVVKKVNGSTKVSFQEQEIDFKTPWKRLTMVEAVKEYTGIDFDKVKDLKEALKIAKDLGVKLDDYLSKNKGLILAAIF